VAAGFNVVDDARPDVGVVLQRFFGDARVGEAAKREVTARLLQIIAEQSMRNALDRSPPDSDGEKQ
jgi:hypothetical protein